MNDEFPGRFYVPQQVRETVRNARGEGEAAAIKAKLLAEAEGWEKRAQAMKKYNDAARGLELGQRFIDKLPEMIEAAAKPLSSVDKFQIYDFGSNNNSGGPAGKVMGLAPKNVVEKLTWLKEAAGIDLTGIIRGVQKRVDPQGDSEKVEETKLTRKTDA